MTSDQHAESVARRRLRIWLGITERADREGLWDMPLREIDLEAMVDEISERINGQEFDKP